MIDITVFLDDVAMKVAEWPTDYEKVGCQVLSGGVREPVWGVDFDDSVIVFGRENAGRITRGQWLQRRKELINELCDSDAPEWAKWKAQDSNGVWHWYRGDKPRACRDQWGIACGGSVSVANKGETPAGHVWRTTLKEVKKTN